MLFLRALLFSVAFYVTTALFVILGSPLLLGPRSAAMWGLKAHARCCQFLLRTIVGARVEIRGADRIPSTAALVASKHQSAWDTFGLIPLFDDPVMVMKAELGWIPFYGWFAFKHRHILVARDRGPAALRALISQARARAAEGRQIVIFPEGTRQAVGAPASYKPGILALYDAVGLPCIPIALNSGLVWPRSGFIRRPGTIVVEILEPIPPGLPRAEFRSILVQRIEDATTRLVAEARLDHRLETLNEHK